ncbi:MAG: hypothetical protein HW416_3810 [Chloroflexi bacterium]|nr:hypothetical protein [Chloroflexota bacterium]
MSIASPIGADVIRIEGKDKVTGGTKYTGDFAFRGMLWGAILRSTVPHGRVVRFDARKALALPGVQAVLTGPDIGNVLFGRSVCDVPVFAYDHVRYVGEPIAGVAAADRDTANEALNLIEVEYEEWPAVFDPFKAMQPDAPLLHPKLAEYRWGGRQRIRDAMSAGGHYHTQEARARNVVSYQVESKGDVAQGFRDSDLVLEHTYQTSIIHQSYIEPHTCIVSVESGGKVRIWATNKSPFGNRELLSMDLDVPAEDLIIERTWIGGDYGGKGSPLPIPMAYFLSKAVGRPVKIVWDGVSEFVGANPRHATTITIKSGLKRDGAILAREVKMVADSGAYGGYKPIPGAIIVGSHNALGVYNHPHGRFECSIVYTNHVPAGHMRSPGSFQSAWACEADVDRLAEAVGMDPFAFRLKNGVREGDVGPLGEEWFSTHLEECLDAVRSASGWAQPKAPNVGRGLAISQDRTGSGASTTQVEANRDGTVTVRTSASEQGAGMLTVIAQVAANELQVPMDRVSIALMNTEAGLFDYGSSALATMRGTGQATLGAAAAAREKLVAIAAEYFDCAPDEVRMIDGVFRGADGGSSLSLGDAVAHGSVEGEPVIGHCHYVGHYHYDGWKLQLAAAFSAMVVEVEVDPRSGQVEVRRITNAAEIGTLLNPLGATGQMEGASVVSLGHTLMEELRLADGVVQNTSLREYKIPTSGDIPAIENILIHGGGGGPGPYGAKTVADLALIVGPAAITNAICDAVGARFDHLPITAERVYQALRAREIEPAS